jgi:hypothetical protein
MRGTLKIRQSRMDRDGWDLRTSGAVTTAQSAAGTLPPDSITCGSQDSSVPFCVDTNTPPNQNLALAATWLSMTKNVEEDWDPDRLRIFTGKRSTCDFSTIGRSLINCCDSDPDKLIGKCSEEEIALARDKQDWKAHLIGTHCVDKGPFGRVHPQRRSLLHYEIRAWSDGSGTRPCAVGHDLGISGCAPV